MSIFYIIHIKKEYKIKYKKEKIKKVLIFIMTRAIIRIDGSIRNKNKERRSNLKDIRWWNR